MLCLSGDLITSSDIQFFKRIFQSNYKFPYSFYLFLFYLTLTDFNGISTCQVLFYV